MGAPVSALRRAAPAMWSMCAWVIEDLLDGEFVTLENGDDARNLVAGIDHDGLAGGLVAQDGAVAL